MTMARLAIFLLGSLWAASAFAQSQPVAPPNPQEQIERTIGNLFITNTTLQAQLQDAKAQIVELKKQLEEAKKVSSK